ncbi:hypothetical protein [Streptomyces chryseus]|nr:hypothetical protein [Streptomyces chryseus]
MNYVDDAAPSMAEAFRKATQRLVKQVFCSGQAEAAEPTHTTG